MNTFLGFFSVSQISSCSEFLYSNSLKPSLTTTAKRPQEKVLNRGSLKGTTFLFCILLSMLFCAFKKKMTLKLLPYIYTCIFSVSTSFWKIFYFSSLLIIYSLIKCSETLRNYHTFSCRIRCSICKKLCHVSSYSLPRMCTAVRD